MEYLTLYRCLEGHPRVILQAEEGIAWCRECQVWYPLALLPKEEVRFSVKTGNRAWASLWR